MKIRSPNQSMARSQKSGFSVIIMLALLTLVLGFIVANSQALSGLHSNLNLLEKKQIRRLNESATNAPPQLPVATLTNSTRQQITAQLSN